MSRLFAAFLLIVVLAIGGSAIAATAYQAGVTALNPAFDVTPAALVTATSARAPISAASRAASS